jgi:hypothetical protein
VADFNGDGFPDFALLNGDEDITVFLNNGNGKFSAGYTFLGGFGTVLAGDFNSDHKPDLVQPLNQGVAVLVGLGNGAFKDYLALPSNGRGNTIAADFNGDHKLDLLTNRGVLLGKGKAKFGIPIPVPNGCSAVFATTVGDFNRDGKLDIAGIYNGNVIVCLGKGNGEFAGPKTYDQGIIHQNVLAGDFNHDGILDLAASDQNGVSILLGNGDGTFQNGIPTGLNASFPTFVLGDFNHDGNLDLAAITGSTIAVLLGKGDGTFRSPVTTAISEVRALAAGDLNSDGNLDLVVSTAGSIDVLLGKGDGSFKPPINYPALNPATIVIADFNGDGKLDVALRSEPLQVRYGNGDGTLQKANSFSLFELNGSSLLAGDFVGDGRLDLVTAVPGNRDELIILLHTP